MSTSWRGPGVPLMCTAAHWPCAGWGQQWQSLFILGLFCKYCRGVALKAEGDTSTLQVPCQNSVLVHYHSFLLHSAASLLVHQYIPDAHTPYPSTKEMINPHNFFTISPKVTFWENEWGKEWGNLWRKMVLDSRQVLLVYWVEATTDVWFCYSFHSREGSDIMQSGV